MRGRHFLKTGALALSVSLLGAGLAQASSIDEEDATETDSQEQGQQTQTQQILGTIGSGISASVGGSVAAGLRGPSGGAPTNQPNPNSSGSLDNGVTVSLVGSDGHGEGGSWMDGLSLWGSGSVAKTDQEATDFDSKGGFSTFVVGGDKRLDDNWIVGLAIAQSTSSLSSTSQIDTLAVNPVQTSIEGRSRTVAPYVAYILNDNIYFDATAGYSWDTSSIKRRTAGGANLVSRHEMDGSTRFVSANATYLDVMGDFSYLGTIGFQRSITHWQDANDLLSGGNLIEKNSSDFTFLTFGGQLSYAASDQLFPYAGLTMEQSLTDQQIGLGEDQPGASGLNLQDDDKNWVRFNLGFDAYATDHFTFSGEVNTVLLRTGHQEYGGFINARYEF